MTILNTIKKLLKISIAFLILISLGITYDLFNKFNNYGWVYEETRIINNVTITTRINLKNSIYFCIAFWVITFMILDSLILIDKLKF